LRDERDENRKNSLVVASLVSPFLYTLQTRSPKSLMWADGWTVVTRDGSLSAQCEHTLLITKSGVEVLTASPALAAAAAAKKESAAEVEATKTAKAA
jgi:methionine aminopeptidase